MKRISFLCEEVKEGKIFYRYDNGVYECWTCSDGCCDLIYQFGIKCSSMEDFKEIVKGNYKRHNLDWCS